MCIPIDYYYLMLVKYKKYKIEHISYTSKFFWKCIVYILDT